jgi:nitroimidazol reductase NimA-like FMN-containing flavoprotein (pyridoxamine 5'-phosphate oxidase superfamily)
MEVTGWAADAFELRDFLDEPNLARIATLDRGGDPHVVPAWYQWDGERFFIGAQAGDRKVANVVRYGRASIEVDGDIRRRRGILARGAARVIAGPEGRSAYERVSAAQLRPYQPYRPSADVAARMAARGDPVVIEVTPDRIISWGR